MRSIRTILLICALMFMAGAVESAEISDYIAFDNTKSMRGHGFRGDGRIEVLSGRVGTVDERIGCWTSAESIRITLRKRAGEAARVQIQEVYPPDAPGARCTYQIYAGSKLIYIRDYSALMLGRVSYFVDLDDPALVKADKVTLQFRNSRKQAPLRICGIWLYSDFDGYCKSAGFSTPFYLTPLMSGRSTADLEKEFLYLKSNIRPRPDTDIKLGCADEHHYMNRDDASTRKQFGDLLSLSKKYNMPLEIAFVSWWSGTPMWFPDGKGGKFSDPQYQQICWSETDNHDDGDALKKLLGNKYDVRYGFTVPNRWSSTPWLTMNSPVLNAARARVIGQHLDLLSRLLHDPQYQGADKYLLALEMENEPRYWDLHCPDEKYPAKRRNLSADFNPVTVAAAAKDGVKLDPADGLDNKERLWLHENVARYQQGTYDAHARALKRLRLPFINSQADAMWHEVYSHGFPQPGFPMEQVSNYHPGLEWNRLHGCRPGLEDVAIPAVAYLDVAREWGRWAQVNYEENNGKGKEWHLRALRSCYSYGARFYNFYNWQSINREGGWLRYVQQFCGDEKVQLICRMSPQSAGALARHSFVVDLPGDWSTANQVRTALDQAGEYALTVYDSEKKDRILGYAYADIAGSGDIIFNLPNSIPLEDKRSIYLTIEKSDGGSFRVISDVSLYMDSARERMQSLMICWRADAQLLISELDSRGMRGLDAAEALFTKGQYKKAYEEAVSVEMGEDNPRLSHNAGRSISSRK